MASPIGTLMLTGANGGLGVAIVSRFLASPVAKKYKGLFTVRNPATAHAAKKAVNDSAHFARHEIFPLDMSTLAGVRAGAGKSIVESQLRFTEDGFETHFGVNYLADFLLVLLLLQSMDEAEGRIIIVSSWSHNPHDARNNMFLRGDEDRTIWNEPETMAYGRVTDAKGDEYPAGYRRYGRSKSLIIMFMYELQRRLASTADLSNISVLAVDPSAMPNTGLIKDAPWAI